MADFSGAFSYLIANEGTQFVADPMDRGGATRYGVTLATLTTWRKALGRPTPPTAEDVRALTINEAGQIYTQYYWNRIYGDQLTDNGVACALLDTAVLCGVAAAVKVAQGVAGGVSGSLFPDGVMGPKTLAALNAFDRRAFLRGLVSRQIDYFDDIVARDLTQRKFLKGWVKRAAVYRDLNW